MVDIILRDCGSVGWLGLAVMDGKEVYRTGKHHRSSFMAHGAVQDWLDNN